MLPVTVAPSRIELGGSVSAILTGKVRVAGSACVAISRAMPVVLISGLSASAISTTGSVGTPRSIINCAGTLNTASFCPSLAS